MIQKFLIDNAIKIIMTIGGLLISTGIFIGTQQKAISDLKEKISSQEVIINAQQDFIQKDLNIKLARHEWYVSDFQNRIIYLEREKNK